MSDKKKFDLTYEIECNEEKLIMVYDEDGISVGTISMNDMDDEVFDHIWENVFMKIELT